MIEVLIGLILCLGFLYICVPIVIDVCSSNTYVSKKTCQEEPLSSQQQVKSISKPLPSQKHVVSISTVDRKTIVSVGCERGQTSKGEWICGMVLRELFPMHRFRQNVRPDWLPNIYPGGPNPPQNLELDWYCAELKLAVEFNGRQHYDVVPVFHGQGTDAERRLHGQKMRDAKKIKLCQQRGVDLVIVRYDCKNIRIFLRNHPIIRQKISTPL